MAVTWPLAAGLAGVMPQDRVDPGLNTWLLWWNAHSVPFTPGWWDAPQFHPAPGMLAVSEHLAGLAVLATPLQKLGASPLLAYNVLFLLSFALSALGAHLLAHELSQRHDAGLVAGLAFGFAPYRAGQLAHLQVLSAWPMPLVLLGLHLYLRTRRRRFLLLFGGAWLWQALINGYFMAFVSLLVLLWLGWFLASSRDLRAGLAIFATWALCALPLVPLVLAYSRVHALQEFAPRLDELESMSADALSWLDGAPLLLHRRAQTSGNAEAWLYPGLTAPGLVLVAALSSLLAWRRRERSPAAGWRAWLHLALAGLAALFGLVALLAAVFGSWSLRLGPLLLSVSEGALHKPLGLAFTALLVALLASPAVRSAWRAASPFVFYALATLWLWILCLGPLARLGGVPIWDKAPYFWLARLGLQALRVPARFAMPAALCLALAAALALVRLAPAAGPRRRVLAGLCVFGLLWDGWLRPLPLVAPAERLAALEPRSAGEPPGVVLELPLSVLGDPQALYRATFHGRPLANGYGGREPRHYTLLRRGLQERERSLLSALAAAGPLDVVVDREADGGRWASWMEHDARATRLAAQGRFEIFRLPRTPPAPGLGARLTVRGVRVSANRGLAGAILDGDVRTLWSSGAPQRGGERLVAELEEAQPVAAVVTWLGVGFVSYPRLLRVDTSLDGETWTTEFRGPTAGAALLGCVEAPLGVPVRLAFPPVRARYVRLAQVGQTALEHWAVAELELRGPP